MQTLLLTSQGLPKELEEAFLSLITKPIQDIRVSFIITAALSEGTTPPWLTVYRDQLLSLGIKYIEDLDLRGKTPKDLGEHLKNIDIIFVNGGNTFYLLKWVKESGFDILLPRLLNKGVLYVGISAGSYICCPTIEQAMWKHQDRNSVGLSNLTALNLVPFLISAHFEEKYREFIELGAKNTHYPVVTLNDTQAVLVQDTSYRIIGSGDKVSFNGYKDR